MRRSTKFLGGIVVFLLLLVIVGAAMSGNNSSTPTATPTVVATAQATKSVAKATATPQPTATPTAAPTASPTSTPSSGTVDISAMDSLMTAQGYTITSNFKDAGKTFEGYPMYSGEMTKGGLKYSSTIIQADSQTHAMSKFSDAVSSMEQLGFSGDYTSSTQWVGTQMYQGTALGASALVTDTNAVITIFAGPSS